MIEDIFEKDYAYSPKIVNKYLLIIKTTKEDVDKIEKYKKLLFSMMKEIVNKNINNFLSLLINSGCYNNDLDKKDLICDCYFIFDKCLKNYKVNKKNNFYFYFNKSMSRSFFRDYQKQLRRSNKEVKNFEIFSDSAFANDNPEMMSFLLDNLKFSEIQKTIINSKLLGQRLEDYFQLNPEITSVIYYENLKQIKEILKNNEDELKH
jgi:hypothetical protein